MTNIQIQMGNDAMRTTDDVAFALRAIIRRMENGETSGRVMDQFGNAVGTWEIDLSSDK